MERQPHIHCPLCRWEPGASARWACSSAEPGAGCGTRWNTFWTAGCCPGCGHFWAKTQCPACKQSSPHEDWYHYPSGEDPACRVEEALEAGVEQACELGEVYLIEPGTEFAR